MSAPSPHSSDFFSTSGRPSRSVAAAEPLRHCCCTSLPPPVVRSRRWQLNAATTPATYWAVRFAKQFLLPSCGSSSRAPNCPAFPVTVSSNSRVDDECRACATTRMRRFPASSTRSPRLHRCCAWRRAPRTPPGCGGPVRRPLPCHTLFRAAHRSPTAPVPLARPCRRDAAPPLFKPHANHIFASTPRMLRAPRAALAAEGTEM